MAIVVEDIETGKRIGTVGYDAVTLLALALHREHRAAEKAMNRAATGKGSLNVLLHDHGFSACGKRKYFFSRARMIIKRSQTSTAETLGEAEFNLLAEVLRRRIIVGA